MGRTISHLGIAAALASCLSLIGCGGSQEEITEPDAVTGATDMPMEKEPASSPEPEPHICEKPLEAPEEVWPRIEAVRLIPAVELTERCGLDFVELVSRWRGLPVDLLDPIVSAEAANGEALLAWVAEKAPDNPTAAASVVAMDVVSAWEIGEDPGVLDAKAEGWSGVSGSSEEIAAALQEIAELKPILKEVSSIHEMRCMLQVNPLGFAVDCKPIHPQGKEIDLSWKTATRDGLLEDLELTECKGRSCKKLKKTAARLKKSYLALVKRVDELKTEVYREQIKAWLVLPPFKSQS